MSNVFFVSDTHFGHENIIKYCNRPYANAEEMTKDLIARWNATITKRDTVYHLGDVCFKSEHLPIMDELNGAKKILILGNHDQLPISDYASYFDEIYGMTQYKGFWLSHCPMHPDELRNKKNIHGHTHTNNMTGSTKGMYKNVSVENIDYKPISFAELTNPDWRGLNK